MSPATCAGVRWLGSFELIFRVIGPLTGEVIVALLLPSVLIFTFTLCPRLSVASISTNSEPNLCVMDFGSPAVRVTVSLYVLGLNAFWRWRPV